MNAKRSLISNGTVDRLAIVDVEGGFRGGDSSLTRTVSNGVANTNAQATVEPKVDNSGKPCNLSPSFSTARHTCN
jgi:Xaa-Pro aminopeptidase